MDALLGKLRDFDALRDSRDADRCDGVSVRTLPSNPPEYARHELARSLSPAVCEALNALGIERLYQHQWEAIGKIQQRANVVIVSPPASGKTLCFTVPIAMEVMRKPESHALMIYPMKALANDQRFQLERFVSRIEGSHIESWLYDGDTPEEHRKVIRQCPPHVLITNPEMLHLSFLQHCEQWEDYLRRLRYVVIDEIHEYRGYFGTNVGLLLRRFMRKLQELEANPQLILASATCANGLEHAERLTGQSFELVHAPRALAPRRHLAFINPDIPSYSFHRIFLLRIARAALACLASNYSTIVFCPTRRFAEEASQLARRDAADFHLDAEAVVPYRGGFLADQRRDIEDGLRTGRYRIVFSTNALEIGIDIGKLDVCILAGFPDSVMSAWQRIGRAGRSWDEDAYVLFYAFNNPVDQFYVENIDAFLNRPLHEIMLGIDNEELMARHIPCLLYERSSAITEDDGPVLGRAFCNAALEKQKTFRPVRTPRYRPHNTVPIRNIYGGQFRLVYKGHEIGTISASQVQREAYVGAIYRHFGKSYLVESHGEDEILLGEAEPDHRTEPMLYSTVTVEEILSGKRLREVVSWYYGALRIYDNFAGYRVIDEAADQVVDERRIQAPTAVSRVVRACWSSIETDRLAKMHDLYDRLRVVERLVRIGMPFVIPCDRHDVDGLSSGQFPMTAYWYETVPGGIGIAEKLFTVWPVALRQGIRVAEACDCESGCPRCIFVGRWEKNVESLDKCGGVELAQELLIYDTDDRYEIFDPQMHQWVDSLTRRGA